MCVLAISWASDPQWRLVIVGHRDEFHGRPAAPLARWDDHPHIAAGRDLEAGGSWLGISDEGRFAVITNRPRPEVPPPDLASRGALVADYLAGSGAFADPAMDDLGRFNPFNLITADREDARLLTNTPDARIQRLAPGLYGLANGGLDEPWPKTLRLKTMLGEWLASDDDEPGPLFDRMRADDAPQVEPREASKSPLFILNPVYGTRCSTMLAIDHGGTGWIAERRYDSAGATTGESLIPVDWS